MVRFQSCFFAECGVLRSYQFSQGFRTMYGIIRSILPFTKYETVYQWANKWLMQTEYLVVWGVIVNVLHCDLEVSEFKHDSRYTVHIRTLVLKKGIKPFILPAMG